MTSEYIRTKNPMEQDELCGAECRDGTPCQKPPNKGSDRCRFHGGQSTGNPDADGAPKGKDNGSWKHGAFSDLLREDLSEAERNAHEQLTDKLVALNDGHPGIEIIAPIAAEALLRYKRSGDDCFLREWRQHVSEFNVVPNEEQVELSGSDGDPLSVQINHEHIGTDEDAAQD